MKKEIHWAKYGVTLGLIVTSGCFSSIAEAQVVFSQNFDGQTTGNTVTGFTAVTPSTATARPSGRGAVILDEVLPDKVLNIYDYDSANNARVEQDFGPLDAGHLSLDFRRNADIAVNPSTESTRGLYVTFGLQGTSQGTQANRAIEFRLFNNGQYRMNRGVQDAGGNFVSASVTSAQTFEPAGATFNDFSLDLFVYSGTPGGSTLSYTGPDSVSRVLDPNSFAVFLNDAFITPPSSPTANGNFGIFNTAFYGTASNLGRIGLVTGGSSALVGFDFIVDNVELSMIPVPEPSTFALIGLGASALLFVRRKSS